MVGKVCRATRINDVDWERLARGNEGAHEFPQLLNRMPINRNALMR